LIRAVENDPGRLKERGRYPPVLIVAAGELGDIDRCPSFDLALERASRQQRLYGLSRAKQWPRA